MVCYSVCQPRFWLAFYFLVPRWRPNGCATLTHRHDVNHDQVVVLDHCTDLQLAPGCVDAEKHDHVAAQRNGEAGQYRGGVVDHVEGVCFADPMLACKLGEPNSDFLNYARHKCWGQLCQAEIFVIREQAERHLAAAIQAHVVAYDSGCRW